MLAPSEDVALVGIVSDRIKARISLAKRHAALARIHEEKLWSVRSKAFHQCVPTAILGLAPGSSLTAQVYVTSTSPVVLSVENES
jgi:hypothetical protein